MTKTVILIDHPVGQRDDRASRRIAEMGYRIEWCCPGDGDALPEPGPEHAGVVVYGGTESANDDDTKPYIRAELAWIDRWLGTGKPFLGLCLGGQLLARALGAGVAPHPDGMVEIGYAPIEPTAAGNGFLNGVSHAYQWHKEGFELPARAELLAAGSTFPNQAFRYGRRAYGLQFHPEVSIPVMTRWMTTATHMLELDGAHPRERQLDDAAHHDAPLAAWLDDFLEHWLDGAD